MKLTLGTFVIFLHVGYSIISKHVTGDVIIVNFLVMVDCVKEQYTFSE